jgi:thioredoxin 1
MASDNILNLSSDNFDGSVTQSDLPVLVDFWAIWCGPCKAIAPLLDQAASSYEGKVRIGKVDVDKNAMLANRFGIRNIPTLLLFKDGQVIAQHTGGLNRSKLNEFIDRAL